MHAGRLTRARGPRGQAHPGVASMQAGSPGQGVHVGCRSMSAPVHGHINLETRRPGPGLGDQGMWGLFG